MNTMRSRIRPVLFMRTYSAALLMITGSMVLSGCYTSQPSTEAIETRPVAVAPPWAPVYDDGRAVRYYYLPDYEVYYDVWDHEFAYLDQGNWVFTRELAGPYAHVDLSTAFVVVLNNHVYEPWMHHEYYVAHYPRYYYLSVYNARGGRPMRGFNENGERPIRFPGDIRTQQHLPGAALPPTEFPNLPVAHTATHNSGPPANHTRQPGDERQPTAISKPPAPAPTLQPATPPVPTDPPVRPPRTPQPVHYYGNNVGKPVKVEPHMMRPKDGEKDKTRPKDKER